jgi:Domain found in Dishevelled, Egl-10, and Pleckstrin (DEP)
MEHHGGGQQDAMEHPPLDNEGMSADMDLQEISKFQSPLEDISKHFQDEVPIKDRRYRARFYRRAFVGSDAVSLLTTLLQDYADDISIDCKVSRAQGTALGIYMMHQYSLFEHVASTDHVLYDDYYFYRFRSSRVSDEAEKNVAVSTSTLLSQRFSYALLPSPNRSRKQTISRRPFSAKQDEAFLAKLLAQPTEPDGQGNDEALAKQLFQVCTGDKGNNTTTSQLSQSISRFDEFAALNMMADDLEMVDDNQDDDDVDDGTDAGGSTKTSKSHKRVPRDVG